MSSLSSVVLPARTTRRIQRTISFAVLGIATLAFSFSFDNAWILGQNLGVPGWAAPCVAPAVDLTVVVLVVSLQYLRAQGVTDRLIGPRILLAFAGAATFVLNTAQSVVEHDYGRACFDGVAPTLLIMWSEVAPALLSHLHAVASDETGTVPDEAGPSPELLGRVRELDAAHRDATGRPITRDELRAALKVSNAVAGSLLRAVRAKKSGAPS